MQSLVNAMAFMPPLGLYRGFCARNVSDVKFSIMERSTRTCNKRRAHNVSMASLDVLVVGAETRLGANLVSRLCKSEERRVSCIYSSPRDGKPNLSEDASVPDSLYHKTSLDVTDTLGMAATISSIRPNAVVSCIGGDASTFVPGALSPYEDAAFRDLPAAKSLVDACVDADVDKLVFVSMLGAGDSEASVPFQVMASLRPLLLDLSDAEEYIRKRSELKWTIVRPAPIEEDDEIRSGSDPGNLDQVIITEDTDIYGTVTVDQIANALAHIVSSDKVAMKTLQVVNRQQILITAPYVRPLESWENLPVTPAIL